MKKNKKKYMIAIVAFAVFAVLFALGLKANTLYSNTISNKQMSAQKEQKEPVSDSSNKAVNKDTGDKTKPSKSTNPSTVTSNGIVKVTAKDPESKCTFQIIDTVHGNKMIIAKDIDSSMDGQAVGYITERILDDAKIKYRATGSVSTLYFAAIDGLEEKKAGKLSGWCYYVKKNGDNVFHKPNIGSGQWVWHTGDVVVWRYLADGIHDGYEGEWETK